MCVLCGGGGGGGGGKGKITFHFYHCCCCCKIKHYENIAQETVGLLMFDPASLELLNTFLCEKESKSDTVD